MTKRIAIAAIRLYQSKAPKGLRDSCRFEPSCSEYTAKAIEKYGLLIGIRSGTKRLFRCKPPHGGVDKP